MEPQKQASQVDLQRQGRPADMRANVALTGCAATAGMISSAGCALPAASTSARLSCQLWICPLSWWFDTRNLWDMDSLVTGLTSLVFRCASIVLRSYECLR